MEHYDGKSLRTRPHPPLRVRVIEGSRATSVIESLCSCPGEGKQLEVSPLQLFAALRGLHHEGALHLVNVAVMAHSTPFSDNVTRQHLVPPRDTGEKRPCMYLIN